MSEEYLNAEQVALRLWPKPQKSGGFYSVPVSTSTGRRGVRFLRSSPFVGVGGPLRADPAPPLSLLRAQGRLLSIARTYGPVVARVIEPPCGPVDGLLSPLGLRVNHLLSVEQGPVG